MMEILFFCLYYHISEISKKHILSIIIIFKKGTESYWIGPVRCSLHGCKEGFMCGLSACV